MELSEEPSKKDTMAEESTTPAQGTRNNRLRLDAPYMKTFFALLVNTLLVSLINFTVWFAITFYVFLQTRSVFATGWIAGIYLVATALTGIWFGSLVDHHRKKTVMQLSALVSLVLYAASLTLYLITPEERFGDPTSVTLWAFVLLLMAGVIAGNIRMIAMPTVVTLLIPEDRRDRANGLVGTAAGISFLVTSVISGLLVGASGMFAVLVLALAVMAGSLIHLALVSVPEGEVARSIDGRNRVDVRGTLAVIGSIPGALALIIFAAFNNFLGGAFMALLDAYGLSLMSVQAWGLLWGLLSTGFIVGGLLVAKTGLSSNPVRLILLGNLVLWAVTLLFPVQSSIVLMTVGLYIYMLLVPYVEAAEQTVLQKVVPYERQGRVFGFAQSVEQAASPLTAFLISPVAQFFFIPFMTTGAGAKAIGSWFGTGMDRGIALVFMICGVLGLIMTTYALNSRFYRQLSERYRSSPAETDASASSRQAPQ
jgi:MFS transporter, DHA3 family, multidrug efflux protein